MKKTIPYAIYTAIGFIVYFLLMKLLGLERHFILRIFNFFIMGYGLFALLRFAIVRSDETVGYLDGLRIGMIFTVVSVLIFIAFLGIYVKFIDPAFIDVMKESGMWAINRVSIVQAAVGVFIEGVASGLIITFAWMQYFKAYIRSKDSI